MHILFLTDNFPPEVNAPASRTFEHCKEWVSQGHQVTVITCAPNFPQGKVFAGYRNRWWQTEEMAGIKVIRVWTYITANAGFIKRILDYLSYLPPAIIASCWVRQPDVVIGTSPQFFTACAAYGVSVIKRIPFVFELRDIWPESIKAVGAMNDSFMIRALEKLELFLYRKADLIVSVTHSFKTILRARGVDADKIAVITNGVDGARFFSLPKDAELVARYGLEQKFVAGYVGTHGLAHHLETILDAAKLAMDAGNTVYRFLLLGDGAKKAELVALAASMHLDNVIFIDSVAKEQVVRYLSLLDVSIIHLKKMDLFTAVIPSKLFESMAMGIPVLHGVLGESADIVVENQAGIVFEPENAAQLYQALLQLHEDQALYQHIRQQGFNTAQKYDRITLANQFLALLQALVSNKPSTS